MRVLSSGGIIKSAMAKRGFRHRRAEDQFSIRGEYARHLQYVYSREQRTKAGLVVDLLYFAVDILNEKLLIGLYRENADLENGIYINSARMMDLTDFNAKALERVLVKLVTPVKDKLE